MAENRFDVYVSYASEDKAWAERLSKDLLATGLRVFIDRTLDPGADFSATLDAAVDDSDHLVVLWSHHAQRAKRVESELSRVEARRRAHGNWPRITLVNLDHEDYHGPEPDAFLELRDRNAYAGGPENIGLDPWRDLVEQIVGQIEGSRRSRTEGSSANNEADVPLPSSGASRREANRQATSTPEVEPRTQAEPVADVRDSGDDYAVVIGITSYPRLSDLPTATADARAFAEWLSDPDGGAVASERVLLVTADDPSSENQMLSDADAAFEPLTSRAASKTGERIGRRLYIFASGRGSSTTLDELALTMPGADPEIGLRGIDLKAVAEFFRESGAFEEVVLFADCVPVRGPVMSVLPTWKHGPLPALGPAAFFYASARRTTESVRPSRTNTNLGAFTQALLEGFRSGSGGVVGSDVLSRFLRNRLGELTDGDQEPEISSSGSVIQFGSGATPSKAPRILPLGPTEHVAAHADNPALVDELGRRPFAEIIAARIEEVRRSNSGNAQEAGAFMVNLHGPWGAGKTSVLNFLKANLQDEGKRAPQDQWVVVEFNAWRHQRLQPPWWSLIKEIQAQAAAQLDAPNAGRLRRRWLWWRFRADWLPGFFSVTFIVAALLIMTVTLIRQGAPMSGESGIGKAIELGLGLVSAFIAGGAGIVTLSRSLLFGSATAAQSYMDARSDPLGPIVTLFQHLVDGIERPLAVFIDDLDRCDGDYVIALLEGIQTLLRTRRVTYVVAADRKWICTCFENKYGDFAKTIGEPGRPLGYLFLDKVFQVSAAVPRLSPAVQLTYWQALLKSGVATEPKKAEEARQVAESEAQEQLKGVRTKEEFDQKIEQAAATGNVRTEQAMRAAVAKQITSPDVLKETEHRLRAFAGLLEPNPRAMKRLVNAYGMYQAAHVLERRTVSPEALARWTIIELRWPLLAECIAARPDLLGVDGASVDGVPKKYARLLEDASVKAVLSVGADGRGALTEQSLREIVGDVAADGRPRVNENALPPPAGRANSRASLT